MSNAVAVGIAGLGRAGWNLHALTLESLPEKYKVVAVSDQNPARLQEAQQRFGCQTYADPDQILADPAVELVVVALPSHLHADFAVKALQAGKHVMIEKPFATDLQGADRMIAAARQSEGILTGSQNLRFTADYLKLSEIVASGKLGRIHTVRIAWHWFRRRWDWQTIKEFGGGSLNNDGSHVIDQALLFLGDAQPEVFCHMEATPLSFGDAEDHVKIILTAPNAPLIDMEFSNAVAFPQDTWFVLGTQGGLTGTHGQMRWKYLDTALLAPRQLSREATPDRSYNKEELPWIEESCNFPTENYTASNKRLYVDLFQTLRHNKPLTVTPESIRQQLSIIEQCRQASGFYAEVGK